VGREGPVRRDDAERAVETFPQYGAYAICAVVEPPIGPRPGQPRVDWLTRLRFHARPYQPPPPRQPGQMGLPRKWGTRLPPLQEGAGPLRHSQGPERLTGPARGGYTTGFAYSVAA